MNTIVNIQFRCGFEVQNKKVTDLDEVDNTEDTETSGSVENQIRAYIIPIVAAALIILLQNKKAKVATVIIAGIDFLSNTLFTFSYFWLAWYSIPICIEVLM